MKISIGILAYNESASIHAMLNSLLTQSLFTTPNDEIDIEIIVVPNGCTDDTANVAKKTLDKLLETPFPISINWQVCELEQAGKSNAWNVYVHQLSEQNANYLFLMDADIELLEPNTLSSMITLLEKKPDAWVAVDRPIKDITLKKNKNLTENLSVLVSNLSGNNPIEEGPAWICGQLYCAKTQQLRQLWLPTQLPAQDSFLYTMIATDGLRSPTNPHRIILAKSAAHSFEAYTQINRLFRHEKWLILSSAVNELLYKKFKTQNDLTQHTGELIKKLNEEDPGWLKKSVQESMQLEGWWLIPSFILIRRFQSLRYKSLGKVLLLLPISICAFIADLILSIQANLELHQGSK